MALITEISEKETQRDPSVHGAVEATFVLFEKGGETYLQIDTYGSSTRQSGAKVSQTMQFGEGGRKALLELLSKAGT